MKAYSEEFKSMCLWVALSLTMFSPKFTQAVASFMPEGAAWASSLIGYAAFLLLAYGAGVVLIKLIPYQAKEWVLYPRIGDVGFWKPGCTIFERLGASQVKDDRFDSREAKAAYAETIEACAGGKPEQRRKENQEWYALYTEHKTDLSVAAVNGEYLFCRDAAVLSLVCFALCMMLDVVSQVAAGEAYASWTSMLLLLMLGTASWLAARGRAKRLVTTVIAVDLSQRRDMGKEEV